MIRGIGVDIMDLARIAPLEGKWDDPFFKRIFTEGERAEAAAREAESGSRAALRYFAGRFAIKEAVAKALNAQDVEVEFPQIETLSLPCGAPRTRIIGSAAALVGQTALHVSLSHEENAVVAFCVAESDDSV